MLDMYDIFWPQEKTDRWEVMHKRCSSNLLTYWKNFRDFDSTTLSESNARIRTFLNLAYSQSREDNTITLQTSEVGSWFILRTHGEEINDIDGVKIDFPDKCVHLRKSNTEPIIRVHSEAATPEAAEEIGRQIMKVNEDLAK